MEPENLQTVLQEAGIQVDMKNLQNPTEDFMIYLITEYLKKFNFDGNEISKSTQEQLDCLSCPDSAIDAIKVINLYSAMASVCHEIFLKDFCLTDITSPGPKRARKHIKMLFNFFAYVKNKMVENEMAFVDLENKKIDIENMIEDKNSIMVKIGATIGDRENKAELKLQLQEQIDHIRKEVDNNNKTSRELEYRIQEVRMQQQEAFKKNSNLKDRVLKLHKVTTELQSKIVRSPEEYAARSKELSKVLQVKKEERQVLTDSIMQKKQQIQNNEHAQVLVKDLNDKFAANTSSIIKELKETSMQLESVQKELDALKEDIAKWTHTEMMNPPSINSKDEDLKGHEQLLFELDNQYIDKDKELNSQKVQLQELKNDLIRRKGILENELKTVAAVQKENSNILEKYKQHFNNEVSEELTLQELITSNLLKTGSRDF